MEEALARYLEPRLPGARDLRVSHLVRIPGGASRETWMFKAVWHDAAGRQAAELVLRKDPPHGLVETSRAVEFAYYQALASSPVPLPNARWVEDDPSHLGAPFLLLNRVPDIHSDYHVLLSPEWDARRPGIARQLYELLARLHAFEWRGTPIEAVAAAPAPDACWVRELDAWEKLLDAAALRPVPIARAAIRWLRRNPPPPARRLAVVHGDYRVGNVFFHADGTIRAVADWELAHLGDPIEDLAWSFMEDWEWARDGRKGGIVTAADAVAVYEAAGGVSIDPFALQWWSVLCGVKAQALWHAGARTYQDGASDEIILPFLACTFINTEDEHLLRSLGRQA